MSGWSAAGALIGLAGGAGAVLVMAGVPIGRRPGLRARLEPYVRDAAPSRLLDVAPPGASRRALQEVLGPWPAAVARQVERVTGGSASVQRRLDQLGGGRGIEQFRAEQLLCGLMGAALGAGAGSLLTSGRRAAFVPVVALLVVGGLLGLLIRDHVLAQQVRRRQERMLAEFPAVAELLALSVGAGEGAAGALDRVARTCSGELAAELRRTVAQTRTGTPLHTALEQLATRSALPALSRFVDGLVVALERGTPLGDVLRAQAQDVRELARRRLLESGGRREIAMTVPVVFLILPVTVLFAVFPGWAVLDVG